MYFKLVYDHRFFSFLTQIDGITAFQRRLFKLISIFIKFYLIKLPLVLVERLIALILILPIPIYSSIIYVFIKSFNGFFGYYIRAIYYSSKAKKWKGNILIDEDVVLENIGKYEIDEFVMIDKKVMICADKVKIGKGVHIGMGTIIAKGGEVIFEDFSATSYSSVLVASSDSTSDGYRFGPMVPTIQRKVTKGKILLKKNSWVTSNVVILPNTVIGEGSIVSPGSVINKNTKDWKIRLLDVRKTYMDREKIKFSEPEY